MKFSLSIQDIITMRKSVRSYLDDPVGIHEKDVLKHILDDLSSDAYRFKMIDFELEGKAKIGTYGMIKGASAFLVGVMKRTSMVDAKVSLDFGADFEKIVLKATELGLGTCWLGGTFNSKDVERQVDLNMNEQIVIVSPLGYSAEATLREKLTRFLAHADDRKPWADLFFAENFGEPLSKLDAGHYAEVLEMVRLAPSAKNMQPWRIVKRTNRYDFYAYQVTKKNAAYRLNLTYNDLGIAKTHFELMAAYKSLKGHWEYADVQESADGTHTLIGSWICDG